MVSVDLELGSCFSYSSRKYDVLEVWEKVLFQLPFLHLRTPSCKTRLEPSTDKLDKVQEIKYPRSTDTWIRISCLMVNKVINW